MSLSQAQRKRLRSIGHTLKPIVTVGDKGLTDTVLAEIRRALTDHELVKVKLAAGDRDDRQPLVDAICADAKAQEVITIGKMTLLYRRNPKADPKKSNLPH